MLPVATAIQHGARFKVTVSCCDLPHRQYFGDLFNKNGGVFSHDKKPSFAAAIYKKQCSLRKVQKEPEKNGKKDIKGQVWACFQRYAGGSLYLSEETNIALKS